LRRKPDWIVPPATETLVAGEHLPGGVTLNERLKTRRFTYSIIVITQKAFP
jgi:hypothetical protein